MALWYIAPSTATTTGAGSREQPFKANAINWSVISAGDTIFFRTALGNYNETITLAKSGTDGNYITIDSDAIDGGKALIDGQSSRLEGIIMSGVSYVAIKNIKIQNMSGVNNRGVLGGGNSRFKGVEVSNCFYGIAFLSVLNPYVEDSVFNECSYPVAAYDAVNSVVLKNIKSVVTTNIPGSLTIDGSTPVLLSLDNILLDGGNPGATNVGLLGIYNISFMNGSTIKNVTVKNSAMIGGQFRGCNNIAVTNLRAMNNFMSGVYVGAGAYNINFMGCEFSLNRDDGIDFIDDAHDINLVSCVANKNGYPTPYDSVNSGDGFSAHGTCYNINHYFCSAVNNRNSGFAHANTSAGTHYHCTSAFNGDSPSGTNRGGVVIGTTGDNPSAPAGSKSWKTKNCVIYKNYPRAIYLTSTSKTSSELDYNSYKEIDTAKFASLDGGASEISWAAYHSTYEAHSKNEDAKVLSNGMIPADSPCVNAAHWIPGINDAGCTDPWGKKLYGLPDTGAHQGAGMPTTINRPHGLSKHFS